MYRELSSGVFLWKYCGKTRTLLSLRSSFLQKIFKFKNSLVTLIDLITIVLMYMNVDIAFCLQNINVFSSLAHKSFEQLNFKITAEANLRVVKTITFHCPTHELFYFSFSQPFTHSTFSLRCHLPPPPGHT